MLKLNRRYKCVFHIGKRSGFTKGKTEQTFTIAYPTTLQLNIKFGCMQTAQQGHLRFFNVNPDYQKTLWKDIYDGSKFIDVQLYAGYGSNMPLIFAGEIMKCYTWRQGGETEFVTEMEVSAAPEVFRNGFANTTISKDIEVSDVFVSLFNNIPDVGIGYISKQLGTLKRSTPFIGNPIDLIKNAYGSKYQVFIENGLLNVLADNEVKKDVVLTITAESGLLGSPKRSGAMTEVETIFEPQASVGGLVNILSDSMPDLNETFKCLGVEHKGIISYSDSGKLTTILTLSNGKGVFVDDKGNLREINPYKEEVWNGNPVVNGWQRPVNGGEITSPYGYRLDPVKKKKGKKIRKHHDGVDIAVPIGTTVYAAADFTNARVYYGTSGYGNYIELYHGEIKGKKVYTKYGHLDSISISMGASGSVGTPIGKSGNTGYSTGPHLHFGVIEDGSYVDPNKYVKL